jgi:hypothetical protein
MVYKERPLYSARDRRQALVRNRTEAYHQCIFGDNRLDRTFLKVDVVAWSIDIDSAAQAPDVGKTFC